MSAPPRQHVTESLAELAEELKGFAWQNVRLLISAGKVDKRKVLLQGAGQAGHRRDLGRLVGG